MNALGLLRASGITYFAQDPLHSYFDERQKNEIYFLNDQRLEKHATYATNAGKAGLKQMLSISISFLTICWLRRTVNYCTELTFEDEFSGIIHSFFRGKKNMFLTVLSTKFIIKYPAKILKIWHVTIFPSLNIASESLNNKTKCHKRLTWSHNFWIKSKLFPEIKVSDHGLSPFPMQNRFLKLYFSHTIYICWLISKQFVAQFTTNSVVNLGKKNSALSLVN